ncbi:MAG: hypothetical protein KatS3mg104_2938 [Phycisphaerae bacterium]|nr:MAG: hypothetical protein KatS3mg104_2938 [Phycisphaerae bacterium]
MKYLKMEKIFSGNTLTILSWYSKMDYGFRVYIYSKNETCTIYIDFYSDINMVKKIAHKDETR